MFNAEKMTTKQNVLHQFSQENLVMTVKYLILYKSNDWMGLRTSPCLLFVRYKCVVFKA